MSDNYDDVSGYTPIFRVIHNNDLDRFKTLLKASDWHECIRQRTIMHVAAAQGDQAILHALGLMDRVFGHLSLMNKGDKDGNTPLHLCVKRKDLFASKILVDYGANLDAKNNDGETPRSIAAANPPVRAPIVDCRKKFPFLQYLLDD